MLTEKSIISKIEILEDGQIQVQRANLVLRDDAIIAKEYHRHVLEPGDAVTAEDARVSAVAGIVWTPALVATYRAAKAAAEAARER